MLEGNPLNDAQLKQLMIIYARFKKQLNQQVEDILDKQSQRERKFNETAWSLLVE